MADDSLLSEDAAWDRLTAFKHRLAVDAPTCSDAPQTGTKGAEPCFVEAVGSAILGGRPSVDRQRTVWAEVAGRIGPQGGDGSAARRRPRFRLAALRLAAVCLVLTGIAVGVCVWPSKPMTPAAIAAGMAAAWDNNPGYHRFWVATSPAGGSVTSEEWLRRPDRFRIIRRRADGSLVYDRVIAGILASTYYPSSNLVLRERSTSLDFDKMRRGAPWEETCFMGVLENPQASILDEKDIGGHTCWGVDTPGAILWIEKRNWMLWRREVKQPDGSTVVDFETRSFDAAADLSDSVFSQEIPADAAEAYGWLPIGPDGLPLLHTRPLEGLVAEAERGAASGGGPWCVPRYLPDGFGYIRQTGGPHNQFAVPGRRLCLSFYNAETGGTMVITERPTTMEGLDTTDGVRTVLVGGTGAPLAILRDPFPILQLAFRRGDVPILILATQIQEGELLKVASAMEVPAGSPAAPPPERPHAEPTGNVSPVEAEDLGFRFAMLLATPVAEAEPVEVPAGYRVLVAPNDRGRFLTNMTPVVTERDVASVRRLPTPQADDPQLPSLQDSVAFRLNDRAQKAFGFISQEGVGKTLVIVVDGKVALCPSIRCAILGGEIVLPLTKEQVDTLLALGDHAPSAPPD